MISFSGKQPYKSLCIIRATVLGRKFSLTGSNTQPGKFQRHSIDSSWQILVYSSLHIVKCANLKKLILLHFEF